MKLVADKMISSIVQIMLFAAIPFIWWYITARKKESFWKWIGLKRMENKRKAFMWITGASFAFIPFGLLTFYLFKGVETAASEFAGLGVHAVLPIIVYAVCNTAFPEELLFRGFLLKRIENKFGFAVGNAVQAAMFGCLHGILFFTLAGAVKAVLVSVFIGITAWVMGYINERKAGGSMIPSLIIHAISNIFSGMCAAFCMI